MYQIRQRLANIGAAFIRICRNIAPDKGLQKILYFVHNRNKYLKIIHSLLEIHLLVVTNT